MRFKVERFVPGYAVVYAATALGLTSAIILGVSAPIDSAQTIPLRVEQQASETAIDRLCVRELETAVKNSPSDGMARTVQKDLAEGKLTISPGTKYTKLHYYLDNSSKSIGDIAGTFHITLKLDGQNALIERDYAVTNEGKALFCRDKTDVPAPLEELDMRLMAIAAEATYKAYGTKLGLGDGVLLGSNKGVVSLFSAPFVIGNNKETDENIQYFGTAEHYLTTVPDRGFVYVIKGSIEDNNLRVYEHGPFSYGFLLREIDSKKSAK